MKELPVFCGKDCGGDACPLVAKIDGGRVVGLRANPASRKGILPCAKGYALASHHYSPHVLRKPLVRHGPRGSGDFRETEIDEALDLAAEGLLKVKRRYGPTSIMDLSSAGSTGALHNTSLLCRRFLNLFGGCVSLEGSYSSNAAKYALSKVFGSDFHSSGFDPQDALEAKAIVLWGANILEARLGAQLSHFVTAAARKGARIICIDPRATSTVSGLGAEWIPIRPATDCALMYAILRILDGQGTVDREYLRRRALGWEEIFRHCSGEGDGVPKTPEWASRICGISEDHILSLARLWTSVKPVMLIPGYSIQRTEWGEEAMRLSVLLQLASGNFSLKGGSAGSLNNRSPKPRVGTIDSGDEDGNRRIPISRWPDAILGADETGHPPIKAVYAAGSNLLNQGGDVKKNIEAFGRLDFAVCNELYLTPTARHCDVVLPAAGPLQKEDIGIPWDGSFLLYKPKILGYQGLERSDYEIFSALSYRLGFGEAYTQGRSETQWIEYFLENSEIPDKDAFKREGIYIKDSPPARPHVAFDRDPENMPLGTSSGKLEFAYPGAARWREEDWARHVSGCAALLITPKKKERVHSQGGNDPEAAKENRVQIHPDTAMRLGFEDGSLVRITSACGSGRGILALTESIRPGVASLYEGSWIDPEEKNISPNILTSSLGTRESASCVMHGIPILIERA